MRLIVLVTGFIPYLLVYKPRIYYEEGNKRSNRLKGGALIVSNHYLFMDYPMTMFHWFGRRVHCVMLEYVFEFSWFLKLSAEIIGGISADRESKGMSFIDKSEKLIKKGRLVQIYPEAHNTPDGKIHDFKPSYVLIALRAGAPIVPFIIDGNYGVFKRAHAIIGKPIMLSDFCPSPDPTREEIEDLNRMVREKAIELKETLDAKTKKRSRQRSFEHNLRKE